MINKKYPRDYILDNSYFKWLEEYIGSKRHISSCYSYGMFGARNEYDKMMCSLTKNVMSLLAEYSYKSGLLPKKLDEFNIEYNGNVYQFFVDEELGEECSLVRDVEPVIDYKKFKEFCRKNMSDNFERLFTYVKYSLNNTDLDKFVHDLSSIKGPTLVSGVGGQNVVSEDAAKTLINKNHIIARNVEPRDFNHMDISLYKNVLVCSSGAMNYGVDVALNNNLKHYLLAFQEREGVNNIIIKTPYIERSFIDLANVLAPCAMLNYYKDLDKNRVLDSLREYKFDFNTDCYAYEIFSGYETSVASKYLESTILESGIGIPIVHDKYDYCHGRSTTSTVYNNIAIYFNGHTELDNIMLSELYKYYKDVIVLDYRDEFDLLVQSIYLCKYIAESKKKDLSGVEYSDIAKKLYKFKGEM